MLLLCAGAGSDITAETVQLLKRAQLLRIAATKLKGVPPNTLEVSVLWSHTVCTALLPLSPLVRPSQDIKACLKRLPTKDDVAKWRAGQGAGPAPIREEDPAVNTIEQASMSTDTDHE